MSQRKKLKVVSSSSPRSEQRGGAGDCQALAIQCGVQARAAELAKIEEAKDSTIVQVMDKAIEPDRKSKPKRSLIVLLSALAAGFLAVLLAFVKEALDKAQQNPESSERIQRLRRYLAWRQPSLSRD